MVALKKGARITGAKRSTVTADVARRYAEGRSIRQLASEQGRSYGFVHRLLAESGVVLRSRGGSVRGKRR